MALVMRVSQVLCELRMFSTGPGGAAHKMQEVLAAAAGAGRETLLEDVRRLAAEVLPMQALHAAAAAVGPVSSSSSAAQPLGSFPVRHDSPWSHNISLLYIHG